MPQTEGAVERDLLFFHEYCLSLWIYLEECNLFENYLRIQNQTT